MNEHVCGPWSDCDAACMEHAYREYEADEADRTEPREDLCASGWCGDSACYRCNPWGYPR